MQAKLELTPKNVKKWIDYHLQLNKEFEMTVTNYTTRIKSETHDLHFMRNARSNRTFSAFQKVKSECTKKKVYPVDPTKVNYFATNIFQQDFYADVIYNIDLKAAYATVLLNDKYISEPTFKYLLSLPKMERLACVGMLAGKKNVFKIDSQGKILSDETIISPTADYFFYCVNKTEEIMNEARMILHESFLFTWVDGIYFLDNDQRNYTDLMLFFNQNNFNVSFDILTEFQVKCFKDYYSCQYIKDGKKKIMNVPKQVSPLRKSISNYLLTKDY
jgi:hypothetical protein